MQVRKTLGDPGHDFGGDLHLRLEVWGLTHRNGHRLFLDNLSA
jgi:hypothetical protein